MNSTIGYRTEIGCRQKRHFPPSFSQPITGTLSYHLSRFLHLGQCEGGLDSPSIVLSIGPSSVSSFGSCSIRGIRQTTTFKKLPTQAPRAKRKRMKMTCGVICDLRLSG